MKSIRFFFCILLISVSFIQVNAQRINVDERLKGIDTVMNKILADWNVPGVGIGIVAYGELVFAEGYGYRDLEKKLPVTPNTLFQIASNTKLFTATAIGFLVDEGKLDWDIPIKKYIPKIQFYNDDLTNNVTIRDMLSHRVGISRHDNIWFNSKFTRQELFDRLKYLEPSIPLRQGYLYNNLMYAASGQIVEYLSGQTWEEFVTQRLFIPLNMTNSIFDVGVMKTKADFMSPYYEKRDTNILLPFPFYKRFDGSGPAGSIISNINDLSNWLIAQMNNGKFNDKQVIPSSIIKETLLPASLTATVPEKSFEIINSMYGMGRSTMSYKGHYRTQHGGAIGGIFSQVSYLPGDSIGIIVFVNRLSQLPNIITNILYDKLLNLEETPWSERALKEHLSRKITDRESRKQTEVDRVLNTKPTHPLADFVGKYENAAYGIINIDKRNENLNFTFNDKDLPLYHYHFNRFISPDDEIVGKWSLIFGIDAQGNIQNVKVSLDEREVVFDRKAEARLTDPVFLSTLVGRYELDGRIINIEIKNQALIMATAPPQHLEPVRGTTFRIREFSDRIVEFVLDAEGSPTGFKLTDDGMALHFIKRK